MLRTSFEVTMPKALWALAVVVCLAAPILAQDLNTKLTDAARTRDTAEVRKLLEKGADPNTKDKNGRTPLMEAAAGGYTDTVRVLLENGADVNATDLVGWNALFWAALSRRTDALRTLVAKGADVNAKDNEKRTALFWAAYFGYTDTVRALLAKGARANARDSHGWTALMSAADLGHIDTVRALLEKGADVHVRGKDGNTAQSLAKKYKYNDIVALLENASGSTPAGPAGNSPGATVPAPGTKKGNSPSDPAAGTKKGNSPSVPASSSITPAPSKSEILNQQLLQAAGAGDTAEVLSLIREGAGVNARGATYGNTALMDAAARGYTATVRAVLEKGGEVDARDNAGRTALMEAAFGGYTDTVRLLLEKGAKVNATDHEGWTPLFWAAFSRRSDTIRFLLEKGADVNARNKHEDNALIHAAYGGDMDTVAVLLDHHADVNAKDDMGKTALIEAARQGHTDAVRLLLENGAAVDLKALDGSTALSLATQQRYSDIIALLKNPPLKTEHKAGSDGITGIPDPQPVNGPASDPRDVGTQALTRKNRTQAFYRLGLSMRLVEEMWTRTGRAAERAAGSIMADLQGVGAPEELSDLAQQTSTRLAVPLENRKGSAPPLITELRKRLDTFCVAQTEEQFFYAMGGFTYDLNLLGKDLGKPEKVEPSVEESRRKDFLLASSFAAQCAAISECKERALSYLSDAANLLQKTPLLAADGTTLQKLSDEIGIALGTEDR
jgi:ankyrin repeat protein